MKLKKIISIFLTGILFAACSSFLDYEPDGSTVTQEQVENVDGSLEYMLNGVYRLMSQRQTDNHNDFGVKGVDVFTDLLMGDMAMSKCTYGWYRDAAYQQLHYASAAFNSRTWTYYYKMLKNVNLVIKAARNIEVEDDDNEQAAYRNYCLGQALAMRGYVYFNLAVLYGLSKDYSATALGTYCLPIYNEYNDSVGLPMSTLDDVYYAIERDLEDAIENLDSYGGYIRPSKVQIDSDIARGILASVCLQKAYYCTGQEAKDLFTKAKRLAQEVIDANNFRILDLASVTTTGFNSIENVSFMWGQDITKEMTGGLASFWGHVDIYTYGYASTGDSKQIDINLYNSIDSVNDERWKWWNQDDRLPYTPTGKFYSATKPEIDGDMIWVNDVHFMRFEEMFLTVAEASYKLDEFQDAHDALKVLLDQRDLNAAANLPIDGTIGAIIHFNWRVELWGEGRALRVLKRINQDFSGAYMLGNNHMGNNSGKVANASEVYFTLELPSVEANNNINIFNF